MATIQGATAKVLDFFRNTFNRVDTETPVPLDQAAYTREVQDQAPRLSLQNLKAVQFTSAMADYSIGNCAPMGKLVDALLQTDPEIRAALKQLKTAVAGVDFVVTPPNDTPAAQAIADELTTDLENPSLNLRGLKGWIVENHVRGIGLTEAVWNEPTEPHRTWTRFVAIPQQRVRLNRVTGEAQFADSPFAFQGIDVSAYERGKWIVTQPDEQIQDFALRGIAPALLNDWFGRMNVMGWWNMSLERDAMKVLVAKAGSDADFAALDKALKNRLGAGASFLTRDPGSSVTQLEATAMRGGSPYKEYMTTTAQRMFLALLGESQTGIIEQNAGSVSSASTQHEIARYVIEDLCDEIAYIVQRDVFAPWVAINHGDAAAVNCPTWTPKLNESVDVQAFNEALATRPKNIGVSVAFYRQETGWPEPGPKDELLDDPTPAPIIAPPGVVSAGVTPADGPVGKPQEPTKQGNPSEKPAVAGKQKAA